MSIDDLTAARVAVMHLVNGDVEWITGPHYRAGLAGKDVVLVQRLYSGFVGAYDATDWIEGTLRMLSSSRPWGHGEASEFESLERLALEVKRRLSSEVTT